MALNPSGKRKPFAGSDAAARKRAKTYDARALATQSADAALSASGELDVAAYVEAREFEIRALENGMQRSKAALTSRAFQKVPRSLRRRTASHNVKRVPRRLRARAKREMIEDNTPTVTARRRKPTEQMRIRLESARRLQNLNAKTKAKRAASKAARDTETKKDLEANGSHAYTIAPRIPKIKKNKLSRPVPPDAKYKKRQRGKTWLPTHMYHAKRAKMTSPKEPLWRFAVPLSPTEKSYRPSHRARGARGAVAWDMSYMATIQLEGTDDALESVLRGVGVQGEAWGGKGRKWRAGMRSLTAWTFERESPRPIAPVTLVWSKKEEDVEMVDAGKKAKDRRKIFVRVHPSAFLQLWNDLLDVSKKQNPPVMVEDLRFEIGSIEITGPGSTEALVSVLKPVLNELPKDSPEATWNSLLGVTNPSSLPQNALLSFPISDPRLHFPPKTPTIPSSETEMGNLAMLLSSWPCDTTQTSSALFDRPARLAAARQLPSQKAINRRRTAAGPGIYPPPLDSDPQIPVMILAQRPTTQAKNCNAPGSWIVLLPWKCVLPVWYSLMYYPLSSGGNPRFGGLKEQQQLAFEAGEPWFPGDFPGTKAGWEWGLRERDSAKQEWERRPKGRRPEFESLDLGGRKGEDGRGWACDWEYLVSSQDAGNGKKKDESEAKDSDIPPLNIHQLRPQEAELAITKPSTKPALATVHVALLNRGTPTPRARIYRLPTTNTTLCQKWLSIASLPSPKQPQSPQYQTQNLTPEARSRLAASLLTPPSNPEEHLPLPSETDLIGFITTGNYNLAEGRPTGIGSILVSKIGLATGAGNARKKEREMRMCIVRAAGERVGRLGVWEVV